MHVYTALLKYKGDINMDLKKETDSNVYKGELLESPAQMDNKLKTHYIILAIGVLIAVNLVGFIKSATAGLIVAGMFAMFYYYFIMGNFVAYPNLELFQTTPYILPKRVKSVYELTGFAGAELTRIGLTPECFDQETMYIKKDGMNFVITLNSELNIIYVEATRSGLGETFKGKNHVFEWKKCCIYGPMIIYTIQNSMKNK